jgi:hypothetical protein
MMIMKKNFKLIILIIFICLVATTVYALSPVISATIVKYDNSESNSSYDTVQSAIDDLYNKSKTNSCKNVAVPNLGDELVPVTIADDGTVTMVDSSSNDWYDYCNKVWANAVILVDDVSYQVGDTIEEDDIESYFVWIPKYKYKLWNVDSTTTTKVGYRTIDIVFDTNDTKDIKGVSCKTPMLSGETGNCDNGEYMTHPAFISLGVDGFWVGKFQTGNAMIANGTNTTDSTLSNNFVMDNNIIIKPNVQVWRYICASYMFINSYNYKTNLNSHMMKNTEWGAVAYLSNSEYGINTEISVSNCGNYITGYGNERVDSYTKSCNYPYNTRIGYKASTTGNISGIYDMSGAAYEYMASYVSGNPGSSRFTLEDVAKEEYSKYLEVYDSDSLTSSTPYKYRILGDATGELAPFASGGYSYWYSDQASFTTSYSPWFVRGYQGSGSQYAGIFAFYSRNGAEADMISFRIVLSP